MSTSASRCRRMGLALVVWDVKVANIYHPAGRGGMRYWYAVQTKPRQESIAEMHLQRQRFETYLPKILLCKRRRDKWARSVEPLFPRYLFIRVNSDENSLAPVRSTKGVAGLVRFGPLLKPVPDCVIDYIRQAENPDTHQYQADQWPHKPGDTVRVLEGPFAGLTGIFQAATGAERALLLIELLGRQNEVGVRMDAIAKSA
jgi:transcriptional antiterminator RfaH